MPISYLRHTEARSTPETFAGTVLLGSDMVFSLCSCSSQGCSVGAAGLTHEHSSNCHELLAQAYFCWQKLCLH